MENKALHFPTFSVDEFYEDPDAIRDFALSQEFNNLGSRYPGRRTDGLEKINPELFDMFCRKLFSIFYDFSVSTLDWNVTTSFQLIDKFDDPGKDQGWIHKDGHVIFAGIIYLTPDARLESGTSIYREIEPVDDSLFKLKEKFFLEGEDTGYNKALKEHTSKFEETARFNNVYNRLVAFDGNVYHGVNSFDAGADKRLTQVFFINNLRTNSGTPVTRMAAQENN